MTSTLYCYVHTVRNVQKGGNDRTVVVKDPTTKKPRYVLHSFHPEQGQMATATLYRASVFGPVCMVSSIAPVVIRNNNNKKYEEEPWTGGRHLTHRLTEGPTVLEQPDTGEWSPRRFRYRGREYLWKKDRLYEVGECRGYECGRGSTVGQPLARTKMPLWKGLFHTRYTEVRVAAGLEPGLVDLVVGSAMIAMMLSIHGP